LGLSFDERKTHVSNNKLLRMIFGPKQMEKEERREYCIMSFTVYSAYVIL
jgi:hypothetical protein